MINKRLLELDKRLIETHKDFIKKQGSLNPMIILLTKKNEIIHIGLMFNNNFEKQVIKEKIKKFIVNQEILGYFFVSDSNMTHIDSKNLDKSFVKEAVIHQLYTPQEQRITCIIHKGKKIIETKKGSIEENKQFRSEWNLWGKGIDENNKLIKDYEKFKDKNPEKYK